MDVAQLLDPLGFAPHRKVVIANLPEAPESGMPQLARRDLFEHLHCDRELAALRFTDEQVHVFGHDYVAGDIASVPLPNAFQLTLKDFPRLS